MTTSSAFNRLFRHSPRQVLEKGSRSFALATRFFGKRLKSRVYVLYAWCRFCDDVADGSFLGFGQKSSQLPADRVEILKFKTFTAIEGSLAEEEVFLKFAELVREYQIPLRYIDDLLKGMQQDVCAEKMHDLQALLLYCYRVAGTVGLMMCHIMGMKSPRALKNAVDLGIALQLTNIVRDIGDDHRVGKFYFPMEWFDGIEIQSVLEPQHSPLLMSCVHRLLDEADRRYTSGLMGLRDLSWQSSLAVSIAACVYRGIGKRIEHFDSIDPNERVILSFYEKMKACFLGLYFFMTTLPNRVLDRRPVVKVAMTWIGDDFNL